MELKLQTYDVTVSGVIFSDDGGRFGRRHG